MSDTHSAANCPFCSPARERVRAETDLVLTLADAFPVSPGHRLIVPRRHVASFFDLTDAERLAMMDALAAAKAALDVERAPDGYNIGINDGSAAGQTVMHLHVHLIPRYNGDSVDPRGGVRWIFPDKACYWKE
jgi:diadenosine tetraphosphate (Ap4A) HIT family hydrolase